MYSEYISQYHEYEKAETLSETALSQSTPVIKYDISQYIIYASMMMMMARSTNTRGFSSQLESGRLPEADHITYEGVFNELSFEVGPRADKLTDIHIGFCRSGYAKSIVDNKVNEFLALFLKGSDDGQPRDHRRLNSVIVLDISGSMGDKLSKKGQINRLELSKIAIKRFLDKLRPTDSFGLVVFDTKADTLVKCSEVKELDIEVIKSQVDTIKTRGGTTLICGFNEGQANLKAHLENFSKAEDCENRLIMLTDVGDNSMEMQDKFIQKVGENNIHVTIIGISEDFRSSTCEKLSKIKGFNYFCAVDEGDLDKYLFKNFDYTFFPSAQDIVIRLESEDIKSFEVFGTVDEKDVNAMNNFGKKNNTKFMVTQTNTAFPSQLTINKEGKVETFGGLILVKLSKQPNLKEFRANVILSYKDMKGNSYEQVYPVHQQLPEVQQFYSHTCLEQAARGFYFVYEIKEIMQRLSNLKSEGKLDKQKKDSYLESLRELKNIAPQSKLKDVQGMIKVVQQYNV